MNDEEIANAKNEFAAPPRISVPPPPASASVWLKILILLLAVAALKFGKQHDQTFSGNTVTYRGERFKMRKAYDNYEDYKDDDSNLDTNELPRIEKLMTNAEIPKSFPDETAFFRFGLLNLKFPGHGMGGPLNQPTTDDESKLAVSTFEIPMRNSERIIAIRSTGGGFKVVDDFVHSPMTNVIRDVTLMSNTIRYTAYSGATVREHKID